MDDEAEGPNIQGPPTYGPMNQDLPESLIQALRETVRRQQEKERYIRRLEVLRAARNVFYFRGYQHIWYGKDNIFIAAVPGATFTNQSDQVEQFGSYIDDWPIFQRFCMIVMSIVTQQVPGFSFEPSTPGDTDDEDAADAGEKFRQVFERRNDLKDLLVKMAYTLILSGRCVTWTRTEENAARWGRNDDGLPIRAQVATIHSTLETKIPIMSKSLDQWGYAIIYDDPDEDMMKAQYPYFAENIKASDSGIAESKYEKTARLGVLQGSRAMVQVGDAIRHLSTRANCWLRPSMYASDLDREFAPEVDDPTPPVEGRDGGPPTLRDKLDQLFPDGTHAVFIGDTYVGSENQSMDDCLKVGQGYPGEGQFLPCLADFIIIVQDKFNDMMNYAAESFDYGAALILMDAKAFDIEAIRKQKSQPWNIEGAKLGQGQSVDDALKVIPPGELPETWNEFTQLLLGPLPQFLAATPPSSFGLGDKHQETSSGIAQLHQQALGQQGMLFTVMGTILAGIYYQAGLAAANDPDSAKEFAARAENGAIVKVSVDRLKKGRFRAVPTQDSGFPESIESKRSNLQALMTAAGTNPGLAQMLINPKNVELLKKYQGFSELTFNEAEAYERQTAETAELLSQQPIPPSPQEIQAAQLQYQQAVQAAATAGLPAPPPFDPKSLLKPSIPVRDSDYHQWHAESAQEDLNGKAVWHELNIGRMMPQQEGPPAMQPNTLGVLNLELHWKEHLKRIPPPPAMPPPAAHHAPPPKKPGPAAPPGAPGAATM